MKTKNVVLLLVVCCYALTGYAQEQLSYGVKAGMNLTRYIGKNLRHDRQFRTGFHVGVNVETPVYSKIYIQPGLLFSTKGTKYPAAFDNGMGDPTSVNYYCLEIHLPAIYKHPLGNGNLIAGFGPFFSYALQLNAKIGDVTNELSFGKNPHQQKRADIGPMILAGYEFNNRIAVQLGFNRGLVEPNNPISEATGGYYHYGYTISAGYRF